MGSTRSWLRRFSEKWVAGLDAGIEESLDRHSQGMTGVPMRCSDDVVASEIGANGAFVGSQQQTVQLRFMQQARRSLD